MLWGTKPWSSTRFSVWLRGISAGRRTWTLHSPDISIPDKRSRNPRPCDSSDEENQQWLIHQLTVEMSEWNYYYTTKTRFAARTSLSVAPISGAERERPHENLCQTVSRDLIVIVSQNRVFSEGITLMLTFQIAQEITHVQVIFLEMPWSCSLLPWGWHLNFNGLMSSSPTPPSGQPLLSYGLQRPTTVASFVQHHKIKWRRHIQLFFSLFHPTSQSVL